MAVHLDCRIIALTVVSAVPQQSVASIYFRIYFIIHREPSTWSARPSLLYLTAFLIPARDENQVGEHGINQCAFEASAHPPHGHDLYSEQTAAQTTTPRAHLC